MALEIARRLVGGVWRTGPVEEANGGGGGGGSQPSLVMTPTSSDDVASGSVLPYTEGAVPFVADSPTMLLRGLPDPSDTSVIDGLTAGYTFPNPNLYLGALGNEYYYDPDTDWMVPFVARYSFTFDGFGSPVRSGETGKNIRCALYNADANGQPTTRIIDSGNIPLTNDGVEGFVSGACAETTCPAGNYVLMLNTDASDSTAYAQQIGYGPIFWLGGSDSLVVGKISVARAFGAFPASGLSWAAADVLEAGGGNISSNPFTVIPAWLHLTS